MVGAGAFTVLAPAAEAAGSGRLLLLALGVAGLVAWCNATSSARLAARHPHSGGTYVYGREELGPWWGYAAGWCFVVGKTASCAAMATAFAAYAAPGADEWVRRAVAATVVLALTALTARGITRTAQVARVLATLALVGIAAAIAVGLSGSAAPSTAGDADLYGVAQAAGLLFFAFAGYARVATLGDEVREPEHTIPRAIGLALAIVLTVYLLLILGLLRGLGAGALSTSTAPLRAVVDGTGWAIPLVVLGAAAASLGALLGLLAGVGRTTAAMAADRELPHALAALHPAYAVPHRAQLAVGVAVVALVLTLDLRDAIGFSSFGVLLYYLVANLAAFALARRTGSRQVLVPVVGAVGCAGLAGCLPWVSVVIGAGVVLVGLALRAVRSRLSGPGAPSVRR